MRRLPGALSRPVDDQNPSLPVDMIGRSPYTGGSSPRLTLRVFFPSSFDGMRASVPDAFCNTLALLSGVLRNTPAPLFCALRGMSLPLLGALDSTLFGTRAELLNSSVPLL